MNYARCLYLCIIKYIFYHEIGHHRRNHFSALSIKYKVNSIFEVNRNTKLIADPDYNTLRKCLEFDADRYALVTMIERINDHEEMCYFDSFSEIEFITLLARGVNIVNRCFDDLYVKYPSLEYQTHPPPILRTHPLYISAALRLMSPAGPQSTFNRIYDREYEAISNFWINISSKPEQLPISSVSNIEESISFLTERLEEVTDT
jgi:hypothetical protein